MAARLSLYKNFPYFEKNGTQDIQNMTVPTRMMVLRRRMAAKEAVALAAHKTAVATAVAA